MKKRTDVFVVIFCALALISSCDRFKKNTAGKNEKSESIFAVNTYITAVGNLDNYLEFGGDVNPVSNVDIYADTSGKLARLDVVVGDTVRKDQVIGGIDPSKPGMTYSVSPIKAPVSGTVSSLPFSVGATVAPTLSLGKISSTSELEIVMSVPERFVSRIQMNQLAYLVFDAFPSDVFTARITKINPVLDTSTRAMTVTMRFEKPSSKVKAGMYARIKLITENKKNVLVVPYTALVTRTGETYTFIVQDNTVRKQVVKAGIRVDDKVEIISGLKVGDEVVIKGQTLLDDEAKINVLSRENAGGKL